MLTTFMTILTEIIIALGAFWTAGTVHPAWHTNPVLSRPAGRWGIGVLIVLSVIGWNVYQYKQDQHKEDDRIWDFTVKDDSQQAYCTYLLDFPEGRYAHQAQLKCYPSAPAPIVPPIPVVVVPAPEPAPAADAAAPAPTETRQAFEPEMVKLPNGSWMGKYEVTIGEYMACVEDGGCKNPAWLEEGSEYNINTGSKDYYKKAGMSLNNKRYPITGVSWNDTQTYIAWLNGKTNKTYRLPTEEEWFEACQASASPATTYCGSNNVDEVAWYQENSSNTTHSVGGRDENLWHLHDMSGNVWEWTDSFYDETKSRRVLRGGSWDSNPDWLRSADSDNITPDTRYSSLGFRLSRM